MQRVVDAFAISGLRYLRRLAVSKKKKKKRRATDICSFWLDGGAVNSLKRRICSPETSAEHTNTQTTASAYCLTSYKKKTNILQRTGNDSSPPKRFLLICSVVISILFPLSHAPLCPLRQVRGSWSTQARHGTRAASSVTAANSRLAPSPSFPTRTSTTAWPATRTSSLHGARAVKRSADLE